MNNLNTDVLVTKNMNILNTNIGLFTSGSKSKKDFDNYKNKVDNEDTVPGTDEDSNYSRFSLITPFTFNPPVFVDKEPLSIIPVEQKIKLLKSYINTTNTNIKDMFNWLLNSVASSNKTLLGTKGDSYKISTNLKEAYVSSENSGGSTNSSTAASQSGKIYYALIKYNNEYIIYNNDGKVFTYSNPQYMTATKPVPNKTLTTEDMFNIISDSLVIKLHYLKIVNVTYNDGSTLSVKTKPYFYGAYGVRASFNFNKTLNISRNSYVNTTKEITNVNIDHYYYCYLHLCGIYFYKALLSSTYDILKVPKEYFPYADTEFYKKPISSDLSTIDNSKDVEITFEKNELSQSQ